MSHILLVETASPKRICHKLKQILEASAFPNPEISILCRESSRAAYPNQPGITLYPLVEREGPRLLKELNKKNFDALYVFWTGEKQYRRIKLLALRLKAREPLVIGGDGNEFRLTWKAICRHAIFRWRHPLPTDHWDFVPPQESTEDSAEIPDIVPPQTTSQPQEVKPEVLEEPVFQGERILILQTAEPPYILQALESLKANPLFTNPRYTLFCRNRSEVVDSFRKHPLLYHIQIHSEARDSWKHLRELRRSRFNAIILFLTGDPSYWKLKLFAPFLGVPPRRMLIFNESIDCFYFNLSQWFALILHRLQSQPIPQASSKWSHSARILVSLILKSVMLPFRFFWLLFVWLRLRSAGLSSSRKHNDDSLRLPLSPGI